MNKYKGMAVGRSRWSPRWSSAEGKEVENIFAENPAHDARLQTTNLYSAIAKAGPQALSDLRDALRESNHVDLADLLAPHEESALHLTRSPSLNSVGSGNTLKSDDSYGNMDGGSPRLGVGGGSGSGSGSGDAKTPAEKSPANGGQLLAAPPAQSGIVPFMLPNYCDDLEPYMIPPYIDQEEDINMRAEEGLPVVVKKATKWKDTGQLCYKMNSYPRGCALIVNNIDYYDEEQFSTRRGAKNDERRLRDMLEQLYFVVESHENKTREEMVRLIRDFSGKDELNRVDCTMVVFMGHGGEGASEEDTEVIGVDGVGLKTKEIVDFFSNANCKAMIDKPKVFLFQACRGVVPDVGVVINASRSLMMNPHMETDGKVIRASHYQRRIRTTSDMFTAYPVPPGRPANRDRINGTWFIQQIVDVFCENAWDHDLDDMMKMVDGKIKRRNNLEHKNFQAVATTTTGWNKKLFFNPGLRMDEPSDTTAFGHIVPLGGESGVNGEGVNPSNGVDAEDDGVRVRYLGCYPSRKCCIS